MDPVRILFDSVIKHVYGEKQMYLNLDVVYEDIYLILCEAHEKLQSMKKKNEYPCFIFTKMNQIRLVCEPLAKIIQNLSPYTCGAYCMLRDDICAACFETYLVEDIIKYNNGKTIITYMSWYYDVKNKLEYSSDIVSPFSDDQYVFTADTYKIYALCIQKNEALGN